MNWRRVFPVRAIFGRTIYILSVSNFYQQLLWKIVLHILALNLFGYVGDFILAFGKTKNNMKQIWQDFKERWPMAVLGVLFVLGWVLINW